MKNNQNAKKEITRDLYIKIRVSKEEKDLYYKFAEDMGISPSRLARNILMTEAESFLSKLISVPTVKAYKYYLEKTNQTEELKRINSD
jgi:hypothetical protein